MCSVFVRNAISWVTQSQGYVACLLRVRKVGVADFFTDIKLISSAIFRDSLGLGPIAWSWLMPARPHSLPVPPKGATVAALRVDAHRAT